VPQRAALSGALFQRVVFIFELGDPKTSTIKNRNDIAGANRKKPSARSLVTAYKARLPVGSPEKREVSA